MKDMQSRIVMLIGVPGSGKSTWVCNNAQEMTVISTDDILEQWAKDFGSTYDQVWRTLYKDAEKLMMSRFLEAVNVGADIVIDRTNMTKKGRARFLSRALGYKKCAIHFHCERSELERRLGERSEKTGRHLGGPGANQLIIVDQMLATYEEPTTEEFDNIIHYS